MTRTDELLASARPTWEIQLDQFLIQGIEHYSCEELLAGAARLRVELGHGARGGSGVQLSRLEELFSQSGRYAWRSRDRCRQGESWTQEPD